MRRRGRGRVGELVHHELGPRQLVGAPRRAWFNFATGVRVVDPLVSQAALSLLHTLSNQIRTSWRRMVVCRGVDEARMRWREHDVRRIPWRLWSQYKRRRIDLAPRMHAPRVRLS